jgi:hypothetical protein
MLTPNNSLLFSAGIAKLPPIDSDIVWSSDLGVKRSRRMGGGIMTKDQGQPLLEQMLGPGWPVFAGR